MSLNFNLCPVIKRRPQGKIGNDLPRVSGMTSTSTECRGESTTLQCKNLPTEPDFGEVEQPYSENATVSSSVRRPWKKKSSKNLPPVIQVKEKEKKDKLLHKKEKKLQRKEKMERKNTTPVVKKEAVVQVRKSESNRKRASNLRKKKDAIFRTQVMEDRKRESEKREKRLTACLVIAPTILSWLERVISVRLERREAATKIARFVRAKFVQVRMRACLSKYEKESCPICFEVLPLGVSSIGCGHCFHPRCIRELEASGHYKCPCCREPFRAPEVIDHHTGLEFNNNELEDLIEDELAWWEYEEDDMDFSDPEDDYI